MWIQNTTSWAVTVSPLDHFQPFMVIVMLLPWYTGCVGQATGWCCRVGDAPLPNQ